MQRSVFHFLLLLGGLSIGLLACKTTQTATSSTKATSSQPVVENTSSSPSANTTEAPASTTTQPKSPNSEGLPLQVRVTVGEKDNLIEFAVTNPPTLEQTAKDSLPYWSYFWEFGDGTFSSRDKDASMAHIYPEVDSSQTFSARVYLTPRYTSISAKPIKSEMITVTITKSGKGFAEIKGGESLEESYVNLRPNQEPAFGHEIRFALQYEQPDTGVASRDGHLLLFFNEAAFELTPPFGYKEGETQVHAAEQTMSKAAFRRAGGINPDIRSALISQYGATFSEMKTWRYEGLADDGPRNLFFSLQTADTVRELETDHFSIIAIFVPDSLAAGEFPISDLEESPFFNRYEAEIKRSLDPNRLSVNMLMMLSNPVDKTLEYRIDFQNIGEASATTVKVAMNWLPYFDKNSVEILEFSPIETSDNQAMVIEPVFEMEKGEEKIAFYFRKIELRGTNEEPKPIKELTEGHVVFTVRISDDIVEAKYDKEDILKKFDLPNRISTRALITFYGNTGKEDSLKTNRIHTALSLRRRSISVGRNFVGQTFNSIFTNNPLTTGFINNASFGYGKNIGQVNKFNFNWELQYNAFNVPEVRNTNLDSLQLGHLDLNFNTQYSFGVPVVGLFRLGLGVGANALLYSNQGGRVDYRFWELGDNPDRNQYSPWGLQSYVELNKSLLQKRVEISLRYYARYYPTLASQQGQWLTYPQISLGYRLADSKKDLIEQMNLDPGAADRRKAEKKEEKKDKKQDKKDKKKADKKNN